MITTIINCDDKRLLILIELRPGECPPPGEFSSENCPNAKSNLNLKLKKAKSNLNFLWNITKE